MDYSSDYFPIAYSPTSTYLNRHSTCKERLNQLYFSGFARYFYITQIILSLFSMIWVLNHIKRYPNQGWFIALEVIICVTILSEILLRMYLIGLRRFWTALSNIFDIFIIILCIYGIIFACTQDTLFDDLGGIVGIFVLIVRNLVLLLRVLLYFKNKHRKRIPSIHLEEMALTSPLENEVNMQTSLQVNREVIQELYKPRLDVLHEEDEIMESSYKTPSIWKGRASQN
ncbi:unnamed protein product [Blepharisma stoltei]|uniref:Ion transport domain-containing protein n=1 Tax=Blepharisma stoltei TaxID=1481888 RepID=A0AAU9IDD2_9CILI|nr:unnamed protein product [Blepharisma stoltei]